jgi:hypothetical protein
MDLTYLQKFSIVYTVVLTAVCTSKYKCIWQQLVATAW